MAVLNFDATQVEPAKPMQPLPEGDYKVAMVKSENKKTKNGKGSYLECVFQVLDGEHKGRQVWDRLNLDNPNATAVQIAKESLSAICHAVNVLTPKDSSELHNRPMLAAIKLRKRDDNGELSNEVKGYKPLSAANETPVTAAAGAAPWASN